MGFVWQFQEEASSLLVLKYEGENNFLRTESKGSWGEGVACLRNKGPHGMKEVENKRGKYWVPTALCFSEVPKIDCLKLGK